jgi:hypothetical protein
MADKHALYLRDLGQILRDHAVEAREQAGDGTEYEKGQQFAYYSVVSLMQQQAEAFGLPLQDLSLDGLDPERDVLSP